MIKKVALVTGALLCLGGAVWAQGGSQEVGAAELDLLELIITRSIGLAVGLGVVIYGIVKIVQQQTGFGVGLIVLGAAITMAPGIYNGMRDVICPLTAALGHDITCS